MLWASGLLGYGVLSGWEMVAQLESGQPRTEPILGSVRLAKGSKIILYNKNHCSQKSVHLFGNYEKCTKSVLKVY